MIRKKYEYIWPCPFNYNKAVVTNIFFFYTVQLLKNNLQISFSEVSGAKLTFVKTAFM